MPMRVSLTYKTSGPGVYPVLLILGKEESVKRMEELSHAVPDSGFATMEKEGVPSSIVMSALLMSKKTLLLQHLRGFSFPRR